MSVHSSHCAACVCNVCGTDRYTLIKLDLLCGALSALFLLAQWMPLDDGADAPGGLACMASLAASTTGSMLAFGLTSLAAREPRVYITLLAILPIGFGAAAALAATGASAASPPELGRAILTTTLAWYALSVTALVVRASTLVLAVWIYARRERLTRPKKDLPDELKKLAPYQKHALNKIAKGDVLDVKLSGGLDGLVGGGNQSRGHAEGNEERKYVAFNLQLRTLRYGWQEAMGIDQLVSVEVHGPGASTLNGRSSSHSRRGRHTRRTNASPSSSSRGSRRMPPLSRDHSKQSNGSHKSGGSGERSPSLAVLQLSLGHGESRLMDKATRSNRYTSVDDAGAGGPLDRNVLVLTFRQVRSPHISCPCKPFARLLTAMHMHVVTFYASTPSLAVSCLLSPSHGHACTCSPSLSAWRQPARHPVRLPPRRGAACVAGWATGCTRGAHRLAALYHRGAYFLDTCTHRRC